MGWRSARPDASELWPGILREEKADILTIPLELRVRDGSLLKWSNATDAIVRLPKHTQAEQADRNQQGRRSDERDQ
jgi:hypothetical protein